MKYVSLDIETTGLRPNIDQVLQLAMVVEDTAIRCPVEQLPFLSVFVSHGEIVGQPFALGMNAWILDIIAGRKPVPAGAKLLDEAEMYTLAHALLSAYFPEGRITVAGKNVAGFDMPFLRQHFRERFRHRVIDPGSVFVDWTRSQLPSLADLLEGEPVAHDALEDARAVIRVLRRSYPK